MVSMRSKYVVFLFVFGICFSSFAGDIHRAVKDGNFDLVKKLVEQDGGDVNANNGHGKTPLDFAKKFGHRQIAEWLEAHGAHRGGHIDGILRRMLRMPETSDDDYAM
jgi:hypothetical protein